MTLRIALVIEDDKDASEFVKTVLEYAQYTVITADNGESASKYLNLFIPSLVILDLILPKVSGIQILRTIRTYAHLKSTRVIVITGENSALEDDVEQLADVTLMKPVDYKQLLRLVERLDR